MGGRRGREQLLHARGIERRSDVDRLASPVPLAACKADQRRHPAAIDRSIDREIGRAFGLTGKSKRTGEPQRRELRQPLCTRPLILLEVEQVQERKGRGWRGGIDEAAHGAARPRRDIGCLPLGLDHEPFGSCEFQHRERKHAVVDTHLELDVAQNASPVGDLAGAELHHHVGARGVEQAGRGRRLDLLAVDGGVRAGFSKRKNALQRTGAEDAGSELSGIDACALQRQRDLLSLAEFVSHVAGKRHSRELGRRLGQLNFVVAECEMAVEGERSVGAPLADGLVMKAPAEKPHQALPGDGERSVELRHLLAGRQNAVELEPRPARQIGAHALELERSVRPRSREPDVAHGLAAEIELVELERRVRLRFHRQRGRKPFEEPARRLERYGVAACPHQHVEVEPARAEAHVEAHFLGPSEFRGACDELRRTALIERDGDVVETEAGAVAIELCPEIEFRAAMGIDGRRRQLQLGSVERGAPVS